MKFRLFFLAAALCAVLFSPHLDAAESKWEGVDVSVIEKYAEEAQRPPREPFINTDQGDLLLFVFLLAGAMGGFTGGYFFRDLFPPRKKRDPANV